MDKIDFLKILPWIHNCPNSKLKLKSKLKFKTVQMSKVFKWFKHLIQRKHLDWNWISYVFPFSLCVSSYTLKILAERIKFNFVVVWVYLHGILSSFWYFLCIHYLFFFFNLFNLFYYNFYIITVLLFVY